MAQVLASTDGSEVADLMARTVGLLGRDHEFIVLRVVEVPVATLPGAGLSGAGVAPVRWSTAGPGRGPRIRADRLSRHTPSVNDR